MNPDHIGSSFDDFWNAQSFVVAQNFKQLFVAGLEAQRKKLDMTKVEMAFKMETSRAVVDRVLDPKNTSITVNTMVTAAHALGLSLRIELADPEATDDTSTH